MQSSIKSVSAFTILYVLAATAYAAAAQNSEFLFYIAVVFVLGIVVLFVHRRVHLSSGVLWTLSAWGLVHMLGGLVQVPAHWPIHGQNNVLYSLWIVPEILKYDQVVHAYGFGVATWLCWQIMRLVFPAARPTPGLLTFCVLAGMGLGALNEVIEFMATLLMAETNVGDYVNNSWDLVFNMIGAIVSVLIIRWWPAKHLKDVV